MRVSLYVSGGLHAALILWVAFAGTLFDDSPEIDFEVTGVTILSVQEFDALTAGQVPTPVALETVAPQEPPAPDPQDAPEPPQEEAPPPDPTPPDATPPPEPETAPEPSPPTPQADVTDTIAPFAPPSGAPDLPPSVRPVPREAPRIAPLPAPAQAPDVETAPEVIEQATAPSPSETPATEAPPTAPEEATTQTVTEADDPAGGPLGPATSVRPAARPNRPAPVQTAAPQTPARDAIAEAVSSAVADAVSAPAPALPSGPPLSASASEGFRTAVGNCWNVGSLSNEAQRTTVVVGFDMNRNGTPEAGSLRLVEFSGGSDAAAQQAFEAARRAILRCAANFDLPDESYGRWAQIELVFNPNGMRLR